MVETLTTGTEEGLPRSRRRSVVAGKEVRADSKGSGCVDCVYWLRAEGDACGLKSSNRNVANAPAAPSEKIPNNSILFHRASTLLDCLKTRFCLRKLFTQPQGTRRSHNIQNFRRCAVSIQQKRRFLVRISWEASMRAR